SIEVARGRALLRLGNAVSQWLPHLARHQPREIARFRAQDFGRLAHRPGAFSEARAPRLEKRLMNVFDARLHRSRRHLVVRGNHFAVCRVDGLDAHGCSGRSMGDRMISKQRAERSGAWPGFGADSKKGRPKPPLIRACRLAQYFLAAPPTSILLSTEATPFVPCAMAAALSASSLLEALPVSFTTPWSVSTLIFVALTCLSLASSVFTLVVIVASSM